MPHLQVVVHFYKSKVICVLAAHPTDVKSQGDGYFEGVQIPMPVVSHDVSKESLLVAEMKVVLDAVVYFKCAVSVMPPEVL